MLCFIGIFSFIFTESAKEKFVDLNVMKNWENILCFHMS